MFKYVLTALFLGLLILLFYYPVELPQFNERSNGASEVEVASAKDSLANVIEHPYHNMASLIRP